MAVSPNHHAEREREGEGGRERDGGGRERASAGRGLPPLSLLSQVVWAALPLIRADPFCAGDSLSSPPPGPNPSLLATAQLIFGATWHRRGGAQAQGPAARHVRHGQARSRPRARRGLRRRILCRPARGPCPPVTGRASAAGCGSGRILLLPTATANSANWLPILRILLLACWPAGPIPAGSCRRAAWDSTM